MFKSADKLMFKVQLKSYTKGNSKGAIDTHDHTCAPPSASATTMKCTRSRVSLSKHIFASFSTLCATPAIHEECK